ncbi:MAG: aminotransferase class III-fold pyridoxal phosphate-dependent enzyme [Vicinamibacterales bacterium]
MTRVLADAVSSLTAPELVAVTAGAAALLLVSSRRLLALASTLRARAWTPAAARTLSTLVGTFSYSVDDLPAADGAPPAFVERRRQGLAALSTRLQTRFSASAVWGDAVRRGLSDLRFTDLSRVPFPFVSAVQAQFNLSSAVVESHGPRVKTLDGEWTIDVGGSYGVNVAGYDRYKAWIERGCARVRDLGPVLGPLHPIVASNIASLKAISGLDEVSFHMSGTEAVMAAARLVRFNTRRRLIVCFSGAYHGWWDGVQPGLGSERALDDCLTLKDMHPASLAVIRRRAREIAAVFVNPVQSFHPNAPPPNDAVMLASGARSASDTHEPYRVWLLALRATCREHGVPLVFDEVYTGFRLAPGGAQEYFGVHADMVIYGKTLGGGLPVGAVCGSSSLMKRVDPAHPMRMAYVVGTFSAHPAVMGTMREFLDWLEATGTPALYAAANRDCAAWIADTNARLVAARLPVRLAGLGTIWTILYTEPSRFNWLLQYYLRDQGLTLSWVGTGRCLCSFDMTSTDYAALQEKVLEAAHAMRRDGWWLSEDEFPGRARHVRSHLRGDMMRSLIRVPSSISTFYRAVMQRKHDDHHASHNDAANQLLHLLSSSAFLVSYVLAPSNLTLAMWIGVPALLVRQFGHAILEPPCHDAEALLLGYDTRTKSAILLAYLLIPIADALRGGAASVGMLIEIAPQIARHWFWFTMAVVWGRAGLLTWRHDVRTALVWLVKLVTDPLTDLLEYRPWRTEKSAA